MGRLIVTGAAGFIGSHLVEQLLASGNEVIGVDAFTGNYSREFKASNLTGVSANRAFELVEGDLLELNLVELLDGVDSVVHLAAEPGVRKSWGANFSLYLKRNVEATQRLLEAISGHDSIRLVFASSSSIYGSAGGGPLGEDSPKNPASPYGLSKLAAEELVRLYGRERGVSATILRYFTVYGPRQRPEMAISQFIEAAASNRAVAVFGDGEQSREMTYVSDIVDATVRSLEAPPGGIYNVGGGSRTTVNELLEVVGHTLGTEIKTSYEASAAGDVRSTWANLERAERDLGYRPRVNLEDGIKAQLEWTVEKNFNFDQPKGCSPHE